VRNGALEMGQKDMFLTSSGEQYSAGLCEIPSLQGTKILGGVSILFTFFVPQLTSRSGRVGMYIR
jgi:hypothetical protein